MNFQQAKQLLKKQEGDIKDLLNLTGAVRCPKCNRYYIPGYICSHCHTDNSDFEMENEL